MNAGADQHRRWDDGDQTAKVATMIAEENDPKQRALLMLIDGTRRAISDNTSVIQEMRSDMRMHRAEFEAHKKEQDRIINQGVGARRMARVAWTVIAIVLSVSYSFVVWTGSRALNKLDALDTKVHANEADHAKYDAKFEQCDREHETLRGRR